MEFKIIQGDKVIGTGDTVPAKSLSFENNVKTPNHFTLKKSGEEFYAKMKEFAGRTMKMDIGKDISGNFKISLNENEDIVLDEVF